MKPQEAKGASSPPKASRASEGLMDLSNLGWLGKEFWLETTTKCRERLLLVQRHCKK